MNFNRLRLMRSAARVGRMHTVPTLRPQSVGEHTFGVIAILFEVGGILVTSDLIRQALEHDAPEAITGDVPAPAKWKYPELEKALIGGEEHIKASFDLGLGRTCLNSRQLDLIKFADLLELAIYSLEEFDMGNKHMSVMAYNALKAIVNRRIESVTPEATQLYNEVAQSYYSKVGAATPIVDTWHGTPLVIEGVPK